MKEDSKKKQIVKISVVITSILVIFISVTYAFINQTLIGTKRQVITSGNLSLELLEDENNLAIENALPMYDEVGMLQDAFTFRLVNETVQNTNYSVRLIDITTGDKLDTSIVKYGLTKDGVQTIDLLSNLVDNKIDSGTIKGKQTIHYSLCLWIDSSVEDNTLISGKTLSYRIDIEAVQETIYKELVLNGTDPVLSDNLVPVIIEDDGTVKKANLEEEWYKYSEQKWANAVVLEDKIEYKTGDTIPETNIESYFVWIPRYKYKIFDEGNYTGLEDNVEDATQVIEIEFEDKETAISNGSKVGEWLSHPAFQAFASNGFWVGKFESGYKGASNTTEAEVNSSDFGKLQIKPNIYSWRAITVGNAFKVSYDYLRNEESHMMKNTEWGAVAYLQHSEYGSRASVRVNNNSSYITGYASVAEPTCGYNGTTSIECNLVGIDFAVTLPYNTSTGYTASTTGNISGVYDMSGGAWEYVMGYNVNATTVGGNSELTNIYENFFTSTEWNQYYDRYSNLTESDTAYSTRILGDATAEMGPFANIMDPDGKSRSRSSWYGDYRNTIIPLRSWFLRGGGWGDGVLAGIFSFSSLPGGVYSAGSFRIVLTF